jgi:hypothetical protein
LAILVGYIFCVVQQGLHIAEIPDIFCILLGARFVEENRAWGRCAWGGGGLCLVHILTI